MESPTQYANKKRRLLNPVNSQIPHVVTSLTKICVDFVASHLLLVESFCDFPDIMGQRIFQAAEQKGCFDLSASDSLTCMKLFTDSYEGQVMSHINLARCHLGVNYALEHLLLFIHVEELDIASCGLGDKHEILPHIAHLPCLKKLNISENSLTDEGMRKIAAPHRVLNRGPHYLEIVDVSGNSSITSKGMSQLNCFQNLHTVDVTSTNVKCDAILKKLWKFKAVKCCSLVEVRNEGWAAEVMKTWMEYAEIKSKQSKRNLSNKKFYSKSQSNREHFTSSNNLSSIPGYRLLLNRVFREEVRLGQKTVCNILETDLSADQSLLEIYSSTNTFSTKDNCATSIISKEGNHYANVFSKENSCAISKTENSCKNDASSKENPSTDGAFRGKDTYEKNVVSNVVLSDVKQNRNKFAVNQKDSIKRFTWKTK